MRPAWQDSAFMKACRREPTPVTPIWLMRQAGRYMKEYRNVRKKVSFARLCRRPDLAAEVAVTAAERLGVDAAILFSDILLILEPLGMKLEYTHGEGPRIHNPLRGPADVRHLRELEPEALDFVTQAVRVTRSALPPRLPLIGFSGAPFTLASYMIQGGSSRDFLETKAFMYRHPEAWRDLMALLERALARYLNAQAGAGAQALQIFDSWAGALSPSDYRTYALPHTRALLRRLPKDVPVIHFGTRTAGLLPLLKETGAGVIGLDSGVDLGKAWGQLPGLGVMGNLDPCVLLAEPCLIRREARRILSEALGRRGHVFNLGHGVLPQTPVDHARALVDAVHEA
jgi:uroporphyrinogen decarboxylase